jgi:hypothetical protein
MEEFRKQAFVSLIIAYFFKSMLNSRHGVLPFLYSSIFAIYEFLFELCCVFDIKSNLLSARAILNLFLLCKIGFDHTRGNLA